MSDVDFFGRSLVTEEQRKKAKESMLKEWGLTEKPKYTLKPPRLADPPKEMSSIEAHDVVNGVVKRMLEGMPYPQEDGSLSTGEESWTARHAGVLLHSHP